MKRDDLETLGVSVPRAGRTIGLGRNASYEAAKRGDLPTIKIGRRLIVPLEALKRMLGSARPNDTSAL